MSNYNWCHGPNCHTIQTQSRIRGSGDNKVLRTIKIKEGGSYRTHEHYSMFNYFCNQSCLMDFIILMIAFGFVVIIGVWLSKGTQDYIDDQNERLRRYEREHQKWLRGKK